MEHLYGHLYVYGHLANVFHLIAFLGETTIVLETSRFLKVAHMKISLIGVALIFRVDIKKETYIKKTKNPSSIECQIY